MGFAKFTWVKEEVRSWVEDKIQNMETQVGYYIQSVLNIFQLVASVLAPFRSGELSQSHTVLFGGLEGVMYSLAEHQIFVILGTRPHIIEPVNKLALWWPGALHPVQKVNHPGTKPNDYMAEVIPSSEAGVIAEDNNLLNWLVQ